MRFSRFGLLALAPALCLSLSACGKDTATYALHPQLPPVGVSDADGLVIQSRQIFSLELGGGVAAAWRRVSPGLLLERLLMPSALATSGTEPITVVNAPSSYMALDNAQFVIPAIQSSKLDFGVLAVKELFSNNLKVCGSDGNKKCNTALIRMYTTGQAGAGLYNAADQYGAPITAGLSATPTAVVGLDPADAAIVQTYSIPSTKNVIRSTDFTPAPAYRVQADFTNAGAGTYAATLVVEYALAP